MRIAHALHHARLAVCWELALLALPSFAAVAPYDVEVEAHGTPRELRQLEATDVRLVLTNKGSKTWDPARSFNVSYRWIGADGQLLVADGERTALPRAVPSGATIEVHARLVAPRVTGVASLQWDVVEESVTWISQRDPTPVRPLGITIRPAVASHAFAVIEHDTPRFVTASSSNKVKLDVRNDGRQAWAAGRPIRVAYHWIHDSPQKSLYDGERSALPRNTPADGRVSVEARLVAPPSPGIYRLQWDMVEEGVTWFSERDPTPEPSFLVIVLPQVTHASAATAAAVLALIAVLAAARFPNRSRLTLVAALLDLIVLGAALLAKQAAFAAEINPEGRVMSALAAGTVLLLLIVVAFVPARQRPWIALGVNAAATLIIFADLLHFRFFGDLLSVAATQSGVQLTSLSESIASLVRSRDLWLFADLVPGILLAISMAPSLRVSGARPARVFACLLLPLLIPALFEIRRHASSAEGAFAQVFQNKYVVAEAGVFNWHLYDGWGLVRAGMIRLDLPPGRLREIEMWFRRTAPLRAGVEPWFGAARGRNLIMIQVESMQAFVIGYEVGGQEITPHLNRWREKSLLASTCADQTAQGRTSDGEFATQVSLLPLSRGAVAFRYPTNRFRSIAGVLAGHGYRTLSAIPFESGFWNRRVTHRQYGYEESLFDEAFAPGLIVGWGLNDKDFLRQMVPRLKSQRRPYAAYLITLSDHHPYEAFPDALKTLRLDRLEGTQFGNYLHAMHYFDAAFGEFVTALDRNGLLQNAVVAVWGDHASGLRWKDLAPQIGRRATEAELYLAQAVPLMIDAPGASLPQRRDVPCGQIDVAPTLLALLGVDPSPYPFLGRNLLGAPASVAIPQQFTVWRDGEHLFLPRGPRAGDGLCYELPSMRRVAGEACHGGYALARSQVQVSRDVIRHDLQADLLTAAE